jgi:hypothetical protein
MALAVTNIKKRQMGGMFIATFDVTPSGNYVAGGEVLAPTIESMNAGGKSPDKVIVDGKAGFVFMYDYAAKKLLVFTNTAGAANAALGEHTAIAYVANVTAVAHKGIAIWLA